MAKTTPSNPEPIASLMADHQRVQKLFRQFEKAQKANDALQMTELAETICNELTLHTQLEEQVFYPSAREALDESLIEEALIEHQSAKQLIEQISQLDADDPKWRASVTVLAEYVKHHVEEEESEMFPKFKRHYKGGAAADIADQVQAKREELTAQLDSTASAGGPSTTNNNQADEADATRLTPVTDEDDDAKPAAKTPAPARVTR